MGILVDEATVAVENIHTQMDGGARDEGRGASEGPNLASPSPDSSSLAPRPSPLATPSDPSSLAPRPSPLATPSLARAVLLGTTETAVPRLLAMLCILAVFVPSFFMQGAAQALFVPLSLAVGFAVVASYFLSSTFVPVLSVWLLKLHREERGHSMGSLGLSYASLVNFLLH